MQGQRKVFLLGKEKGEKRVEKGFPGLSFDILGGTEWTCLFSKGVNYHLPTLWVP